MCRLLSKETRIVTAKMSGGAIFETNVWAKAWKLCILTLLTSYAYVNSEYEMIEPQSGDVFFVGYEGNSSGYEKIRASYSCDPPRARYSINEDYMTYAFSNRNISAADKQLEEIVTIRMNQVSVNGMLLTPERLALVAGGPGHKYFTMYFKSRPGKQMDIDIEVWLSYS